jgi:hypothetical protein
MGLAPILENIDMAGEQQRLDLDRRLKVLINLTDMLCELHRSTLRCLDILQLAHRGTIMGK